MMDNILNMCNYIESLSSEYIFRHASVSSTYPRHSVKDAPLKNIPGSTGHCPNSDCTLPPFTQTGTLGLFIFGPI